MDNVWLLKAFASAGLIGAVIGVVYAFVVPEKPHHECTILPFPVTCEDE